MYVITLVFLYPKWVQWALNSQRFSFHARWREGVYARYIGKSHVIKKNIHFFTWKNIKLFTSCLNFLDFLHETGVLGYKQNLFLWIFYILPFWPIFWPCLGQKLRFFQFWAKIGLKRDIGDDIMTNQWNLNLSIRFLTENKIK